MNSTVDDFLNEINEIAPLKPPDEENVWQECYDEKSGFNYYWNTKSDEVMWDVPSKYRSANQSIPLSRIPKPAPKIYRIEDSVHANNSLKQLNANRTKVAKAQPVQKVNKFKKPSSDSDDEKITLISSYGGDSESESDEEVPPPPPLPPKKVTEPKPVSEDKEVESDAEDYGEDILTKMKKAAQQLKPSESLKSNGIALVAGYSDSEEEEDDLENLQEQVKQEHKQEVSHSTLFPIVQPIDINDFKVDSTKGRTKPELDEEDAALKASQRKRRIGVTLINNKKPKVEEENLERKGLGFESGSSSYSNFKSGGLQFVKGDTLNEEVVARGKEPEEDATKIEEIHSSYDTLNEKLKFLSVGSQSPSPVQVMIIQIETLFNAMKEGGLKAGYLKKWLEDTSGDLIKLEKAAAPEGWLLQWDRAHKSYYYHNITTGEGQWEYPQPDIIRCDEAMDISTTPPPSNFEESISQSPPGSPYVGARSPTPPPPPIISTNDDSIPEAPLPPTISKSCELPPPPGVDSTDTFLAQKRKAKADDKLNTVLDSFYSDLAQMETVVAVAQPSSAPVIENSVDTFMEQPKKKKKTKVKLAQGLAMKKKGVSQLVEKWKNVQMNL